jgi:hypothetical protein
MIPAKLKDYLLAQGSSGTKHSGATLWDHLSGVHRILQACGSSDDVCTAGLFHSVYGTQSFKQTTIDKSRRHEVQALIGNNAESLVWAFCTLPRPKLLEISLKQQTFDWLENLGIATSPKQFGQDLIRLECANLLEQKKLHEFPYLARQAQSMRMLDREGFSI